MVRPQEFPAVRAFAHFVAETLYMTRGDKYRLDPDGGRLDLVIPLTDNVKIPPEVLDSAFHHRSKGTVIDESGHRAIAFCGGPDKAPPPGELHDAFVYIAHEYPVFIKWNGQDKTSIS
jgi:hypothetical protein